MHCTLLKTRWSALVLKVGIVGNLLSLLLIIVYVYTLSRSS